MMRMMANRLALYCDRLSIATSIENDPLDLHMVPVFDGVQQGL